MMKKLLTLLALFTLLCSCEFVDGIIDIPTPEPEPTPNVAGFTHDIIASETDENTVTVNVTPGDKEAHYILMFVEEDDYGRMSDEELYLGDIAYFEWLAGFYDSTTLEMIQQYAMCGDESKVYTDINVSLTYFTYSYYIDYETGERKSDITRTVYKPIISDEPDTSGIPFNEIWYTTTDNQLITPNNDDFGGAILRSNVYENGKGVMTFDKPVARIGGFTFSDKHNLLTITLPNSLKELDSWTFYACTNIANIVLPESLQSVGGYTFEGCTNLRSVTFPSRSLENYGFGVFANCVNLEEFKGANVSDDGRCYCSGDWLIFFAPAGLTEYTIPDNINCIGQEAFDATCPDLKCIIFHDNFSIWDCACLHCPNLCEFRGKNVSADGRCLIIDGVLNAVAPAGLTEYTLPEGITSIGSRAFNCNYNIKKVTIPDSVTKLHHGCFAWAESLEEVNIPDGVTIIESQAFDSCYKLKSINIPNGITAFAHGTFANCQTITEVTIPENVKHFEANVFRGCTNLTSVYCKAKEIATMDDSEYGGYLFDENAPGRKIYVPVESVDAYKSADGWKVYADDIVAYDFDNGVVVE